VVIDLAAKLAELWALPVDKQRMLSKEDRGLFKVLRVEKGYCAKRLVAAFFRKSGLLLSVKRLLLISRIPGLLYGFFLFQFFF